MAKPKGYYVTLDCRDGQHDACATCFCQCHPMPLTEQEATVSKKRQGFFSKKDKPEPIQRKRSTYVPVVDA